MSGENDMTDVGEDDLRRRLSAQEREIERRDRELGLLAKRLHAIEGDEVEGMHGGSLAVARLALREHQIQHLQRRRGWRSLIRRGPAEAQAEAARVRMSRFFDADWYLKTYPDVAAAGLDPALHYASSGHFEGRNPGPSVDTLRYVQKHPEVGASAVELLDHKERSGHDG
ncbi:hypothetical protein AAD018_015670 [Aestuariibius insulae]|uniref:hypothetical protein n=1 Tax=Aestuariibius insulae TaxID=2058287 RepID=UPI00345EA8E0